MSENSPFLCRRQPTLSPIALHRPIDCRSWTGRVHWKSRGMVEVKSAEAELRQDSILVAWIQTAAGEDRHKDHDNRWTPYRIFYLRQEAWHDIRQWTGNGPACKQHHLKLFLSAETAEIHPTITLYGCRKTLVHSLISYRVDYCNNIFYGATNIVVRRLQSVLNAADRLISNKRKFDHITPVLRDQLHWLPIRQRIEFKIAVFVRNAVHGQGPTYLSRTCDPVWEVDARAHLRSAVRGDLTVPRAKTRRFGPGSFRVSGPVVWNSLSEDIRIPELSLERFKSMCCISPSICLAALTALRDLVRGSLISVSYIYIYTAKLS